MFGNAAFTDNSFLFSSTPQPLTLIPGFLPVSPVPLPHGGQPWASLCSVPLGRGGTPNTGIPGGFLALEFQNQGEQEELIFVKKHLIESKSPLPEPGPGFQGGVRQRSARGGPLPGVEPKEARLQVGMASPGFWKGILHPVLGSGQETAKGPQDTGIGKQTGTAPYGLTGKKEPVPDACPCSHSCPQHLGLTNSWEPRMGKWPGERWESTISWLPPACQNDGTRWKLSSATKNQNPYSSSL